MSVHRWTRNVALDQVVRLVDRFHPLAARPSAPLEAIVWLDSFEPSLMPRTSKLQGVAGGLAVLSARAVSVAAGSLLPSGPPGSPAARRRVVVRVVVGATGAALSRLADRPEETLWRAGSRTGGRLLAVASLGGVMHDLDLELRMRFPGATWRPLVAVALSTASLGVVAGRRLRERVAAVETWPVEQRTTVAGAAGVSAVTAVIGIALARGFTTTRDQLIHALGDSWPRQLLARSLNAGVWGAAAVSAYNAGVGYVGRANGKFEPGYSRPPTHTALSGSAESVAPFEDLGQQGRRFVTDVVTPELITEVLDEPAAAHPIRVFVGFDSEPLYQTGRAELALEELERTGAYDRRYLLLVSPTGTGWVDQTMIESAELLARGDIATVCIQYGRFPSFLSIQKVALGRGQFRLLLMGVKERLRGRPPERRPEVLIFGESLGAWTASDVVMFQGIEGFDHYGIARALWVGLPGLAKWSRNGMARGGSELVPPGSVVVIDRPEQLERADPTRLRAVILSHDNDPIAQLVPDLAIQRPGWLGPERGRGVPATLRWRPLVTFWQTAIDAGNAMVTVPGDFRSFGHDYRADMARVVGAAFDLPPVEAAQLAAVEAALRRLELERAARIAATTRASAPPPPSYRDGGRVSGGVPLRDPRSSRRSRRRPRPSPPTATPVGHRPG